jgi:hypothetical protein
MQKNLKKKAKERGWHSSKPALIGYIINQQRTGKPPLLQEIYNKILKIITKNSTI